MWTKSFSVSRRQTQTDVVAVMVDSAVVVILIVLVLATACSSLLGLLLHILSLLGWPLSLLTLSILYYAFVNDNCVCSIFSPRCYCCLRDCIWFTLDSLQIVVLLSYSFCGFMVHIAVVVVFLFLFLFSFLLWSFALHHFFCSRKMTQCDYYILICLHWHFPEAILLLKLCHCPCDPTKTQRAQI